ncbi:MAG: hypothetical protein EP344_17070 [Bacteroidetes bacterium]|nr:MAG: hypothetical protein EP344_17070 [Bacteroidota bacterium]
MKHMLQIAALLLALHLLTSPAQLYSQASARYWDDNVAFLDFRTRTVDQRSYVREIQVFDFLKEERLDANFGFGEDLFSDTGEGYDERAGDGIYTSAKTYPHTPEIPFQSIGNVQTAIGQIVVDKDFKYKKELERIFSSGEGNSSELRIGAPTIEITIDCDVSRCSCANNDCSCPACEWGISTWCMDWSNCHVKAVIKW